MKLFFAYFSKKNDVLQVDLDLHFQGQIVHFLENFEHKYLVNGFVYRDKL